MEAIRLVSYLTAFPFSYKLNAIAMQTQCFYHAIALLLQDKRTAIAVKKGEA